MKFTTKKRGFTIIELVIVIAVVAILAAVLIPVFSNLVQQGKDADAKVVVRNLNTGLKMETTKPTTMYDALAAVEKNVGINVAKLNDTYTKTGNQIVWDSEYNTFLFVKADDTKVSAPDVTTFTSDNTKLWAVANSKSDVAEKYSYYWNGGDITDGITVATGFDAGEAEINAITYETEAEKTVTIRTNSEKTTLTINAKNSDVYHYDLVGKVEVLAVKGNSYHENGTVKGNLEVVDGHVEVTAKADVQTIIVASETANAATVTVNSGATVGSVAATTDSGKTYLDSATTVPTDKKVAEKLDENVLNNFAGGIGTEASPYLINNLEQWMYLAANSNTQSGLSMQGIYFAVNSDLDFQEVDKQVQIQYFNGHITFNNHTVKNLQINQKQCKVRHYGCYGFLFAYVDGNATISDLTFTVHSPKLDESVKLVGYMNYTNSNSECNVLLENINIDGVARYSDNNTGLFVFWAGKGTLTLRNCVSYAYLYNTQSNTGAFVGRAYCDSGKIKSYCSKLIFENCENRGTIISAEGETHMLLSNYASIDNTEVVVQNCFNKGTIIGKNIKLRTEVINSGLLTTSAYKELSVASNKFAIEKVSGAEKYELTFSFGGAASGGGIASKTFVLSEDDLNSVDVLNWIDIKDVDDKTQIKSEEKYGTTVKTYAGKYVLDDSYAYAKKQPQVTLVVYGAEDTILQISTYTY